jgi:hypothetical protein
MLGCPILRVVCEGWDKQNVRGRLSGAEQWYPTLRQEREGWGTRASIVTQMESLSESRMQFINVTGLKVNPGSAVERPGVYLCGAQRR